MIWVNVLIVFCIILVEAFFVIAEMSLVTLRESQVRQLADRGRSGKRVAKLVANPNRYLSAVQIGVTLTALLSSAFGAVTLSESAADALRDAGLGSRTSTALGFLGVTLAITYVTLVIGELAPKRFALQRADRIAPAVAPVIDRTAGLMRPVIWLLSRSTDVVVRLLGGDPTIGRDSISEEELRDLVAAHESLSKDERKLIDDVFDAGERQLREVMVPRTEVEFLDASLSLTRAFKIAASTTHSRFPVVRGSHDDVTGFVHIRDLVVLPGSTRRSVRVGDVVREIAMLPDTKRVLPSLSEMRSAGHHIAVVVDEYGGTAGIVTLEDLIEELIGDIRDEYDAEDPDTRRLHGGDVEVDGLLNLEDFEDKTGLELPEGPYETVAGYIMAVLGRLPKIGDTVEGGGARLRVTDVDGRRISRVRVTLPTQQTEQADDGDEPVTAPDAVASAK